MSSLCPNGVERRRKKKKRQRKREREEEKENRRTKRGEKIRKRGPGWVFQKNEREREGLGWSRVWVEREDRG